MMNARLNKALVGLLAVAVAGACDDAPVDVAVTDADRLVTNPSFVVIDAGESRLVQAYLANALGNPVAGDVDFEACDSDITVAADPNQSDLEPGTNFTITGNVLGESCVNVSGAGEERTIQVRVVPSAVSATAVTDTVRAGDTGSIDVVLRDADGDEVGPFTETDATFTSSDTLALFFTDSVGGFDTHDAENVTVTVTHTSFGVARELEIPIAVIPGLPASGEIIDPADSSHATQFPNALAGDTVSLGAFVYDTIGNINNLGADITSLTVTSSNPGAATAYGEITPDPDFAGRVVLTIYAVGEGFGTSTITATANTVAGAIPLGSANVDVVEAVEIVSILPDGADIGEQVVITGTGLVQAGAPTSVFIDEFDVTGDIVAATPTAITLNLMVPMGAGDVEVTVDVGNGAASDVATYNYGGEVDEPENDNFVEVTLPFSHSGWFGYGDAYDFYEFVAPTTGTLQLFVDWTNADLDLDIYLYNTTTGAPITGCTSGASSAKPEQDLTGCNVTAGTRYGIIINDYSLDPGGDPATTEYTATVHY